MTGFPRGFLWGAATSSHQVEGQQTNDWTDWESTPGRIADGTRSGEACGWWSGRAEEDLARASELGMTSLRLSLEWSRLEPAPGEYDESAFARYAALLTRCRALGLEPMLGLNHFTLPRWLARRGGWLAAEAPERFATYAARCGEHLAGLATLWSTLNEPSVLALMAHGLGRWPPGNTRPLLARRALRSQLLAHALAARALRRAAPSAKVGLVLNAPEIVPARPDRHRDRLVARTVDWAFTGVVLDALANARLLPPLSALPVSEPLLRQSCDWLGLNYYGRYRVCFDPTRPAQLFGRHLTEQTVHTEQADWGEIAPDGLHHQLLRLGRAFPDLPLYVTENGLYDPTDQRRGQYIVDHVQAVRRALDDGVDVRGYYVWSLVDNFEWAEGWSTPFGLFAVDRATHARRPRPSASIYARICRESG